MNTKRLRLKYLTTKPRGDSVAKSVASFIALDAVESWTGRLLPLSDHDERDLSGVPCKPGDVLFGKLRPYLAKVHLVDAEGTCASEFIAMRPTSEVEARFLRYALSSEDFVRVVSAMSYGTKMPRVDPSDLLNIKLTVPSREQQSRIADRLDADSARIDALIDRKHSFIDLLLEKRSALVVQAVTRGLNPTASLKDSGVKWLGKVPTGWDVCPIKFVATLHSGHTPDKKIAEYWEDGTIPWVSLADSGYLRHNRYICETAYYTTPAGIANSSAVVLPPRSVILSRDATVGLCAIATCDLAVSQHFMAWVCGDRVVDEYLLYVLEAMRQELERLSMGSTIPTIGLPHIRALAMPVPPREEQINLVSHLKEQTRRVDELVDSTRRSIDLLRERRAALISAAVTGQIDIPGTETSEDVT